MSEHMTFGNSSPMATTVAAGINVDLGEKWDWGLFIDLANPPPKEISCPICRGQKSKAQTVCQVCYTNILDSRNGFYPERLSTKEQLSTSQ